jgi:hypothetical protein
MKSVNSLLCTRVFFSRVHELIMQYAFCCSAESRRTTIDIFLKATGYLDCAIRQILPQIPPEQRYCIVEELLGSIGFQVENIYFNIPFQRWVSGDNFQ